MIKGGRCARYVGERFEFLQPGCTVLVRSINEEAGTAYVQNAWDKDERITVKLTELEEGR